MGSETYRRRGMVEVPGVEAARVELLPDARVACFVSFPSQGQGHRTTIAQLVAAELGIAPDRVDVRPVDTAASPVGTGTFASRGARLARAAPSSARPPPCARSSSSWQGRTARGPRADLELRDGRVSVEACPTAA
jgi:carbon-monoxide dehydrogenase large subunit